ncbi:MAG: hypothetical protein N4A63_06875 [Vallitalea sp.]|jgi:hypothetical protein|nr:hypothetical protein [Vallitalea sp.]
MIIDIENLFDEDYEKILSYRLKNLINNIKKDLKENFENFIHTEKEKLKTKDSVDKNLIINGINSAESIINSINI